MTLELLLEVAWKSLVIAGLTLVMLRLLKRRSASQLSLVANLGLLSVLFLPLAVLTVPQWEVKTLKPITQALNIQEPPTVIDIGERAEKSARSAMQVPFETRALSPQVLIKWTYLVPAGLLMLLLVVAIFKLLRLRASAEVLVEPRWAVALAAAQRRMGLKHGTALLVSPQLHSPISWGVMRPVILLDPGAAADEARAEAIIAHELAHVARLDWVVMLLGRVATAIFWFNPLVWLLARRCHEISEEAADDAVLRSNIDRAHYADILIGAARHDNRAMFLAANGVAGAGSLTNRVERVLDGSRDRVPAQGRWVAVCCAVALIIAAPLSALSPVQALPGSGREAASMLWFTGLHVRGSANVSLVHGPASKVRLLRGNHQSTKMIIREGRLEIEACTSLCEKYEPEIEIVTPRLDEVTAQDGAAIQSKGEFPGQSSLAMAIKGGGLIRMSGIEAARVTATVNGGGTIKTSVKDALKAVITGDGSIIYWGDPSVTSSLAGKGVIVRADDD